MKSGSSVARTKQYDLLVLPHEQTGAMSPRSVPLAIGIVVVSVVPHFLQRLLNGVMLKRLAQVSASTPWATKKRSESTIMIF